MKQTVRTRIAPSPTGFPHIGTIYQVLFDYAYAKKHHGQFILRIEDTDRERLVPEAEQVIYQALNWFHLTPDESPVHEGKFGPYRQSERLELYTKYVDDLVHKGHAYYCFCTRERLEEMRKKQQANNQPPMYDKHCLNLSPETIAQNLEAKMPHVVRMKIPENQKISFTDMILGPIEFDSNLIDHQVILKSDGFPTYHLAVVVDDHLMQISHVFRGKEWISSTPKHVLLYRYFGWDMPQHAHLPLILNSDGKGKLSKRHGHASVDFYRQNGFLPEAVLNYLSNIVWNHPEGKEIYTLSEFIELFDITKITSQGARFDLTKLEWVNGMYIRNLSDAELATRINKFYKNKYQSSLIKQLVPLAKERMKKLTEFDLYIKPFIDFLPVALEKNYQDLITPFVDILSTVPSWSTKSLEDAAKKYVLEKKLSMRHAFMALRLATTGEKIGLPLFETLEILGKKETLQRLQQAL